MSEYVPISFGVNQYGMTATYDRNGTPTEVTVRPAWTGRPYGEVALRWWPVGEYIQQTWYVQWDDLPENVQTFLKQSPQAVYVHIPALEQLLGFNLNRRTVKQKRCLKILEESGSDLLAKIVEAKSWDHLRIRPVWIKPYECADELAWLMTLKVLHVTNRYFE